MPTEVDRLRSGMRLLSAAIAAFAEATSDYDRLLDAVARQAADVFHDSCVMLLRDPNGDLVAAAIYDPDPALRADLEGVFAKPISSQGTMSLDALASGQPVLAPVIDLDALATRLPPDLLALYRRIGLRGTLVVPMRVRGEPVGVLAVLRHLPETRVLDELDLELAQDLANHAGLAIANAQLVDKLREHDQLREAHAALVLANERAEAANKELESFSYSVAHDLRAPLRGIDGFSQALIEDYGDRLDEEGMRYLNRVRAQAQRMAELIDDLLALSRVTRADLAVAPIDLGVLAVATLAPLQRAEPARVVEVVVHPGLVVAADARLISIVFENLLANAWKFTSRTANARIEVGAQPHPHGRVFFVRDNGAGFPQEFTHKLFGVFQRLHTEAEFPGTGVGLATVARIITRHHGRVWAEGEPGKGATFYFTLNEPEAG